MAEVNNPKQVGSIDFGRWVMVMVALSLIALGSLFIYLMGRSYLRAKEMREWPVVPALVVESVIENRQHDPYSPFEFSHVISFSYEWEGQSMTGDLISLRGDKWSSKPQTAQKSLETYPIGSRQNCHVNPDQPDQAVLELDSLAPLYSIWFPALFVVGGIGMIVTCLKPRKSA